MQLYVLREVGKHNIDVPTASILVKKMTYEPRKAAQLIAAFLLKNGGKSIDVLKLMKLVYLADQQSAKSYGFTILDEPRFSMKAGPVNSYTKDCLDGKCPDAKDVWHEFLNERVGNSVSLAIQSLTMDDLDELSDADIECIEKVWKKVGHMTTPQIVGYTHDPRHVPEWFPLTSGRKEIFLRDILNGANVDDADFFVEEAEIKKEIDSVFESLRVH